MSIRGKDFRCELDPDLHEKLRKMADCKDIDLSRFGARLLEKAIAGEWHEFRLLAERVDRVRNFAEKRGEPSKTET
jgi:hypothetical protein